VNVLIRGDTETSPALRHEVPLAIGDPFLYLESDGRHAVVTSVVEDARLARVDPDLERLLNEELGRDELIAAGWPAYQIELEVAVRATERLGIREAIVPLEFPVALADRLRERGVDLNLDERAFTERRRRKTATEVAGIRRAADAALAAMGEAASMLPAAEIRDQQLWLDGARLTSESVRARIREVCNRAGAPAPADIMVKPEGPNPAIGHDPGAGPLPAHTPILIDLWPREEASDCWADMT
jgi:Xaa-Pro aminopeptidase